MNDLQVGKEAYVVTRSDSKTLEKARVIKIDTARTSIDIKDNIDEVYGNEIVFEKYYKDIIINDARRDWLLEGQAFFMYKRMNRPMIDMYDNVIAVPEAGFTFDIPDSQNL